MNLKSSLKLVAPYIGILAIMIVLSVAYMSPILEGKIISQHDIKQAEYQAKELNDYQEKTGEYALWTNSAFAGMPSYMVKSGPSNNIFFFFYRILKFFLPTYSAAIVLIYLLGMFVLLTSLKFDKWLALAGAIAFAFISQNLIIISAGHISKCYAVGYMAPVLAGVILVFRKKYWAGGLITMIAMGLELNANHPQITYYLGMMIVVFFIVQFIYTIKEKEIKHFLKASAILFVALIIAAIPNLGKLMVTYEYSKYTIRGKSELTAGQENQTSGLDKDYAMAYSYGRAETLNTFIPNFAGGAQYSELSTKSNYYKAIARINPAQAKKEIQFAPTNWASESGSSGPNYIGAVAIFLFVFGLFLIKGPEKWWLLSASILAILLAWGKNFMPLSDFFLDYVPMYNKFRAPMWTLAIPNIAIPLLALITLKKIFEQDIDQKNALKGLKYSLLITGGFALILALIPGVFFDFTSYRDQMYPEQYSFIVEALQKDRQAMMQKDAFRSLVFVFLSASVIYLYLNKKIKTSIFLIAFVFLFLIDLWPVSKRYMNNDKFTRDQKTQVYPADKEILKDQDLYFKTLELSRPDEIQSPSFQSHPSFLANGRTSSFHKSLGGYHGAKLRRYQEFAVNVITPNLIEHQFDFKNLHALNMLNTRYIIQHPSLAPLKNPYALGNAWFVDEYRLVENADEELEAVKHINPAQIAIIDKRFESKLSELSKNTADSLKSGTIKLSEYKPDYLKFETSSSMDKLAVFSDIYYEKGWKAKIDGQETDIIRANYTLRSLIIPKGEHIIEFSFEPKTYYTGQTVSLIGSIIVALTILAFGFFEIRKKKL